MKNEAGKIAALLKVLANENRLLLLCLLLEEPQTVGRLCERIPAITQSAMSQHLGLLKAHGILESTKAGQSITYRIHDERVGKVIAVLKQYYCKEEGV